MMAASFRGANARRKPARRKCDGGPELTHQSYAAVDPPTISAAVVAEYWVRRPKVFALSLIPLAPWRWARVKNALRQLQYAELLQTSQLTSAPISHVRTCEPQFL